MVVKRTSKSKRTRAKAQSFPLTNYKIIVSKPLGKYANASVVKEIRRKIKAKVPSAKFTKITGTAKTGYTSRLVLVHQQKVGAPGAAIKAHLEQKSPGSKVTVVKV
jgi:hypothetical protein